MDTYLLLRYICEYLTDAMQILMSVECQIKQLSLFIQLEIRWGVQNCIFICEQCERGNKNECMKGQSIVYSIVIIIMAWLNQMKKSLRECSLLQHLAWTQRDFQSSIQIVQHSIVVAGHLLEANHPHTFAEQSCTHQHQ